MDNLSTSSLDNMVRLGDRVVYAAWEKMAITSWNKTVTINVLDLETLKTNTIVFLPKNKVHGADEYYGPHDITIKQLNERSQELCVRITMQSGGPSLNYLINIPSQKASKEAFHDAINTSTASQLPRGVISIVTGYLGLFDQNEVEHIKPRQLQEPKVTTPIKKP